MEVLKKYKQHLKVFGVTEETRKVSGVSLMILALQITIIINLMTYATFKWKNIDDRFVGIKALPVCLTTFGYTVALVVFFDDFASMVSAVLERLHFKIPYKVSHRRMLIIASFQTYIKGINKLWRILLTSYIGLVVVFPVVTVAVNVFLFSRTFQNVVRENYAVPLTLYFPEYFKTFHNNELLLNTIWYAIGYAVQSLYFIISFYVCHSTYTISLCSILNVQIEFKLLKLSVLEMDKFINETIHLKNYGQVPADRVLKCFMRYFVQHHQNTYRKFDAVNKGIRWIAFTVCTTATLYICLSLYTIVQTDEILKKVQEAVFLTTWVNSLFQFCFFGEMLKSEVENFRNALYECPWLEKPIWFKRSMLIMMARTGRPVDIKPFGFYGFDFNRFARAMNAVYCYYNVLCNFKSNNQ